MRLLFVSADFIRTDSMASILYAWGMCVHKLMHMHEWRQSFRNGGTPEFIRPTDDEQTHCTKPNWLVGNRRQTKMSYIPINPKRPMILPNTSTTRIFTNRVGSAASASAAFDPAIPTEMPQSRLHTPTVIPPQNSANPKQSEYIHKTSTRPEGEGMFTSEVILRCVE